MFVYLDKFRRAKKPKTIYRIGLELLVLIILLWIFIVLAGRALKRIAIAQIGEITNTKIKAASVNFDLDGSVFIEGLLIRSEEQTEYDNSILKAKNVYAKFSITSLLLFKPRLKEIRVKNFIFNAIHDLDTGQWNIASLRIAPPKDFAGKMPVINLQGGTLRYSKVINNQIKISAAIPLDVSFGLDEKVPNSYKFSITTARRKGFAAKSELTGFWRTGNVTISGGVSSADIPAFEKVWMIYVLAAELNYDKDNNYSFKMRVKDLLNKDRPVTDTLALAKPLFPQKGGVIIALQKFFNQFSPRGQIDIELNASGNLSKMKESKIIAQLDCKDIWIKNKNFPYPVEHLTGKIDFTENSMTFNNLRGKHGDVELVFDGQIENFGPNAKRYFRITSNNMTLDDDLYNALKPKQQNLWNEFSPSGLVAIDHKSTTQPGKEKNTSLAVELIDVAAEYRNFPYPLKGLTGTLLFDPDNITASNLVSEFKGSKIIIDGKVTGCRAQRPIYDINIKANNIPLDPTLNVALSKDQQQFYSNLDLASQYGNSIVSLAGRFWTVDEDLLKRYHMSLNIRQLELNKELFTILPPQLDSFVNDLQLSGNINVKAILHKMDKSELPDYTVTVDFLDNSMNFKHFPYPLKGIRGYLVVEKDNIKLKNLTAAPADNVTVSQSPSAVKLEGQIFLADNNFSSADLQFYAGNIYFDERLGLALPEKMRANYDKLSPTGQFDLNMENIKVFEDSDGGKYIDFKGSAELKNCNIELFPKIAQADACLKITGLYKTGYGLNRADFSIDSNSLRVFGKTLNNLKSNLNYDYNTKTWSTKNLVADCYDGKLAGNFGLKKPEGHDFEYFLNIGFEDINLRKFLVDTNSQKDPQDYTTGQMDGSLSIAGRLVDTDSSIGRCRLKIENMKVGKLSLTAKLLNVLKLTQPTDYAFDAMLLDSYIKQNNLSFERLDLSGKSLAFKGSGNMNLKSRDIKLRLTARGRRLATAEPTVWQSLADAISGGVVRVDVTGTYQDPTIKTTALPFFEGIFGILGTEKINNSN